MNEKEYRGYIIYSVISIFFYFILSYGSYLLFKDYDFRWEMIAETFYSVELLVIAMIILRLNCRIQKQMEEESKKGFSIEEYKALTDRISNNMNTLAILSIALAVTFFLTNLELHLDSMYPELLQYIIICSYIHIQVAFLWFVFQIIYAFTDHYAKQNAAMVEIAASNPANSK